ncbi:hypothetical protein AJ87_26880 [Rhizobium yanglingense]|nr:hypothetical protein AJ87_26880 [Rhizobium yanglingense]
MAALLVSLASPLFGEDSRETVRVARESWEESDVGVRKFFRTWRNERTYRNDTGKPHNDVLEDFLKRDTVVVYTIEKVNELLGERDQRIKDANARIDQLTNMYNDLATKHDAIAARLEEVDK